MISDCLRLWGSINHYSSSQVFGQLHQFTKWKRCVLPSTASSHWLSLMCAQTQEQRFIINAMKEKVEYQSARLEGILSCMYFRIMSSAEMVFTQKAKTNNESCKSLKCIFLPHSPNFGFLHYINKVS